MKFYKTNAALGYEEYSILLHVYNNLYLVVEKNHEREGYPLGETVIFEKEEEYFLTKIEYQITKSPLSGTFLFDYFINKMREV